MAEASRDVVVLTTDGADHELSSVAFTIANVGMTSGLKASFFLTNAAVDLVRRRAIDSAVAPTARRSRHSASGSRKKSMAPFSDGPILTMSLNPRKGSKADLTTHLLGVRLTYANGLLAGPNDKPANGQMRNCDDVRF